MSDWPWKNQGAYVSKSVCIEFVQSLVGVTLLDNTTSAFSYIVSGKCEILAVNNRSRMSEKAPVSFHQRPNLFALSDLLSFWYCRRVWNLCTMKETQIGKSRSRLSERRSRFRCCCLNSGYAITATACASWLTRQRERGDVVLIPSERAYFYT